MRNLFLVLTLAAAAPSVLAQNCFDGNFGTLIGTDPVDTVLPMQAIGFPFPIGGQTYTHAHVTDHGFIQFSNNGTPAPASGAVLYTPSTANFAAGSPKVCCLYSDIIGSGGGRIYFSSSASKCTVTWINMQNYGIATPRFNFQATLYPTGDVRCVYGVGCTNASTFGGVSDNGIVGITPGNNVTLPASSDLSAGGTTIDPTVFENWTVANTFDMANNSLLLIAANPGYAFLTLGAPANCASAPNNGTGCGGLGLTATGLPSLGNSSFNLVVSGVPVVSPVALVAFGTIALPGVSLAAINMPGCFAYTNLDIGMFTSGPVASGVSTFPLVIPATPSLVGASLAAQGVTLSTATPAGLAVTNGTVVNVGNGY